MQEIYGEHALILFIPEMDDISYRIGPCPANSFRTTELYILVPLSVKGIQGDKGLITQDIVRKLWDEAGNGNIAVWTDGTMTVVHGDYNGTGTGKQPLVILKPIALVNRFELLDFALHDEELLTHIESTIKAAGGSVTRGPQS